MAIKPKCDSCSEELVEFGAILLGPPDVKDQVHKYHLCKGCYKAIVDNRNLDKSLDKI